MMISEITEANFINLANYNVGVGLLKTGENNYELAKDYAKQVAIDYLNWINRTKISDERLFNEYLKDRHKQDKKL